MSILSPQGWALYPVIQKHSGSQLLSETVLSAANDGAAGRQVVSGVDWEWSVRVESAEAPATWDIELKLAVKSGSGSGFAAALQCRPPSWSPDAYVLFPGAAYNGNRYTSRRLPYPPLLQDPGDIGPNVPPIITDVPRLNKDSGPSRIHQTAGDLASPAVGVLHRDTGQVVLFLTDQETSWGTTGLSLEESEDRSEARLTVQAPCVRQGQVYRHNSMDTPSDDAGAVVAKGSEVILRVQVVAAPGGEPQDLFDHFWQHRKDVSGPGDVRATIPLSASWAVQEAKYNRDNWAPDHGYYAVGTRDSRYQDWQIGWVGGAMATHPLLMLGTKESRHRAMSTLDYVFQTQAASGFFYGCGRSGELFNDGFGHPHADTWHLIRKSSDALYFLAKQFDLLQRQEGSSAIPEHWWAGLRRLSEAFVTLWNREGQLGQFVDVESGTICVGGSTSASTAPAGLAAASELFSEPRYLAAAEAAANHYWLHFAAQGVTTGGPGEILQCPDSESAFGLLESFVVLYEVTGKTQWLHRAEAMAKQCASWCVSYDFRFPEGSEFQRLDIPTLGSVIANVQNKHSAPGICTLSGDSLFKLFRATGDTDYLRLLQEIVRAIGPCLSLEERPIHARDGRPMPPGWINERVNLSDWEGKENIGTVFYGSCWPEVSHMLAYAEVPGVYLQPDTGLAWAFDHVEAAWAGTGAGEPAFSITNPTEYPAAVRVLAETAAEARRPLGQNALLRSQKVWLEPGETRDLILEM